MYCKHTDQPERRNIMLNFRIPESFPTFAKWPTIKVEYLNNNSAVNEYSETKEPSEIVYTDRMQEENPMSICRYCNLHMEIKFNIELEEWVYPECVQTKSGICLHPLCYYFSKRERLPL